MFKDLEEQPQLISNFGNVRETGGIFKEGTRTMVFPQPEPLTPSLVPSENASKYLIEIAPDIAARLTAEVWLAFKSVPRRGLEIGGILLGKVHPNEHEITATIEGYKTVESEHRSGPSYLLSEADLGRLQEAIAGQTAETIGVFRSHTRPGDVEPQAEDVSLVQGFGSSAVFLMLSPSMRKGVFFLYEDGKFKSILEIGLSPALASMMSSIPRPEGGAELQKSPRPGRASSIPKGSQLPEDEFRPSVGTRWIVSAAAAIVGFGLGLATLLLFVGGTSHSEGVKAAANLIPPSQPMSHVAPVQTLPLKAMREGAILRLSWAPPPGVSRAILHIQDGAQQTDTILTPSDFRSGMYLYQANSPDVTFQMDAYSQPSTKGAIQVLNVHVPREQVDSLIPPQEPAPAANPPATSSPSFRAAAVVPVARTEEPALKNSSPNPPPVVEPPSAAEKLLARAEPFAPNRAPSVHVPSVHIYEEPVGSRMEDVFGKITFFRKPKKRTMPVVVHREQPVLNGPALEPLTESVLVKVKVWIKPSGVVGRTEIVNFGEPPNFPLAHASVAAARNWTFEPASLEGDSALGEMLLHFQFAP